MSEEYNDSVKPAQSDYADVETVKNILIKDFDYELPDGRIASHPLEKRDSCRLLHSDS